MYLAYAIRERPTALMIFFSVAAAVPFVVDYALHEACRWSLASSQIVPMERRGQTDRVG